MSGYQEARSQQRTHGHGTQNILILPHHRRTCHDIGRCQRANAGARGPRVEASWMNPSGTMKVTTAYCAGKLCG
jgi:hypothetical protein